MDYLFLNARVCTPYELTGGAVLVRDGVIEGVFDHIDPPEGARVILRSHGEPPETLERCARLKLSVTDTTCVFVRALHETVRRCAQEGRMA